MKELRTTSKLIVTVAPTGAFHGKEANPNIPLQPDEIAKEVYDSWNEGASIVHIHAREEATNIPTSDPEVLKSIDNKIRNAGAGCDIIIQHSTASDYIPRLNKEKGIRSIDMKPEMASLDITIPRMITFGDKEKIFITTLSDIKYGAKVMLKMGIKPELEVFNPVVMEDVYALIDENILSKPYWFNFVMGMRRINRSYMSYSSKLLIQLVDQMPENALFSTMGVASDQTPATTQSILLGGHVRVGFEDNIYYKRGELAESNAQLVAKVVRIAKELGCEIASPQEAREMLAIPKL